MQATPPNHSPCAQVDAFVQRIQELQQLFAAWGALQRLERVEIGGTHGRALTAAVKAVYADWVVMHEQFISAADGFEVGGGWGWVVWSVWGGGFWQSTCARAKHMCKSKTHVQEQSP